MQRKAIIHIGMHKTGTTTIQATLAANRQSLIENGVLYPSAGAISTGGHLNLVYETISSWNYKPSIGSWNELIAETREHDLPLVLLSAENFSGAQNTKKIIDAIKAYCADVDAEPVIVAYVRPQYSYINSLYAQNASTGYTNRLFADYVFENLKSDRLDYEKTFGPWFDSFSDVKIIPFEPDGRSPLVQQFFSHLGLSDVPVDDTKNTLLNARLGVRAVEFSRKATETLAEARLFTKAQRHAIANYISSECTTAFPKDASFSGLDADTALSIDRHFAASNIEFFETRLGKSKLFSKECSETKHKRNMLLLDQAGPRERDHFLRIFAAAIAAVVSGAPSK